MNTAANQYDRIRIGTDRNSDHRLIKMFANAFEDMTQAERDRAPVVVNR